MRQTIRTVRDERTAKANAEARQIANEVRAERRRRVTAATWELGRCVRLWEDAKRLGLGAETVAGYANDTLAALAALDIARELLAEAK